MSVDKVAVLKTGELEIVCVVVGCGPLERKRGGSTQQSVPDLQSELKQRITLAPLMEYNHPPTVGTMSEHPPAYQDRTNQNLE